MCKKNKNVLIMKIKNLEFAIKQAEEMIAESRMPIISLTILRRKVAQSKQDLEVLYLINSKN